MADGTTPLGAGFEATIVRTFKAPAALLFDCFVDPERFAKWWGPLGCVNTELDFDPRPGGNLSLRMAGPGYDHVMGGEFIEVDPPRRLVFLSKAFEAPDGGWGIINRNTLTFEDRGNETKLTLHVHVDRAEGELVLGALGGMRAGWGQSLERLGDLAGGGGKMDIEVRDKAIVLARAFDAPRDLVWRAITEPEMYAKWWSHPGQTSRIVEMDVRPGGNWLIEQTDPNGVVHRFWGVYTEVDRPSLLAQTQGFDAFPAVPVVTILKEEWGRTTLIRTMEFPDNAYRDGMIGSGYEVASAVNYDRIASVLATLV